MIPIRVLFLLISILVFARISIAQEPQTREQMDALLQSSYTKINGKETPELAPNYIRMGHFFDRYKMDSRDYQVRLKSLLAKEDRAVLDEYASQHGQAEKNDNDEHTQKYMEIASRAKDMHAMEIAFSINKLTADFEARKNARYQGVLNRLSEPGRKLVNDFAFENIRPMCVTSDETIVANAAPEFYKLQIVGIYDLTMAGKIPPPTEPKTSGPANATESSSSGTHLGSTPVP